MAAATAKPFIQVSIVCVSYGDRVVTLVVLLENTHIFDALC